MGPRRIALAAQLEKMLEFVRMVTTWYGHIDRLSTPSLERLFKNGPKLVKLFGWLNPGSPRKRGDREEVDSLQGMEAGD